MKLASAVICILFTYVNVVHGAVEAGSSFWRSRKEAVEKMSKQPEAPSLAQETLLAQLPSINPQSFTGLTSAMNSRVSASNALPTPIAAQIPVANMKLPLEFANLKSANFPAGWKNNDLTVIRIQDVHMNVEAQSNISKSIQGLIDQGKVDFVALEGAFEEIDVSGFRAFEDQVAIRMVAEYFLKENKISGAIHAALTDSSNIPPFVGVDDKVLHTSHINSYKEAVKHADEQKARLKNEVASTEAEKAKLFNPHLLAFDKDVQAYRSGSLQMGDYVKSLIKHNVPISQVEIFLKALAMEKSLDFSQVEKERAFLIQKLVYNISKNNISELLNVSLSYRLGKLRHTDFYVYLRTLCGKEILI